MIAFYFPYATNNQSNKPSILRPTKMLEAFKKLEDNEQVISLTGKNRNINYKKVLDNNKINYLYIESINKPLLIQCLFEMKFNFIQDYIFFWKCQKKKIPMAIFYRDAYWATDKFTDTVSSLFAFPLKILFKLEFKFFDSIFDVIFLPSLEMKKILPKSTNNTQFLALPPAVDINQFLSTQKKLTNKTSMLYVGNINPTFYDITPIIKLLQSNDNIIFNLCCRKEDWDLHKNYYKIENSSQLFIHHVDSEKLKTVYCNSDIHLMFFNSDNYRDFAVPYKFYESLQYKTPIISNNNTKVASLINELKVGWVLDDINDIHQLLSDLTKTPLLLEEKVHNIEQIIGENTWDSRAQLVAKSLMTSS